MAQSTKIPANPVFMYWPYWAQDAYASFDPEWNGFFLFHAPGRTTGSWDNKGGDHDATTGFFSYLQPSNLTQAQHVAEIQSARADGKLVILSVGGAGGQIQVDNQTQADNFIQCFKDHNDVFGGFTYGSGNAGNVLYIDGLDLNHFEGASASPIWNNYMVNELKNYYGRDNFVVTSPVAAFAPWGGQVYTTQVEYDRDMVGWLYHNDNIDWIGPQCYDPSDLNTLANKQQAIDWYTAPFTYNSQSIQIPKSYVGIGMALLSLFPTGQAADQDPASRNTPQEARDHFLQLIADGRDPRGGFLWSSYLDRDSDFITTVYPVMNNYVDTGGGGTVFGNGIWVNAYYPVYRVGTLPPADLPFNRFTHLAYFNIKPNADGTLNTNVGGDVLVNMANIVNTVHANGKKVTIVIGGQGDVLVDDPKWRSAITTNKTTFINNLVNFIDTHNLDGIDLDWEPFADQNDAPDFVSFVADLHAALPANTIITMFIATYEQWKINMANDIQQYIDRFNLSTYDYSYPGNVSQTVIHDSPLYSTGSQPSGEAAADDVTAFLAAGVAPGKLNISMPMYTAYWDTVTGGIYGTGIFRPLSAQTYASLPGVTATTEPTGTVDDTSAYGSYIFSGGVLQSFNSKAVVQAKVDYIKANNLGGMGVWELGQGYLSGQTPAFPLMEPFANELGSYSSAPSGITNAAFYGVVSSSIVAKVMGISKNLVAKYRGYGIPIPAPTYALPTLIDSTFAQATTTPVTPGINSTGANFIVVGLACQDTFTGVPTDNQGNTYTEMPNTYSNNQPRVRMYFCKSPNTNVNHTFTIAGSPVGVLFAAAFNNIETAAFTAPQTGANAYNTTINTGGITPNTDNSLVISLLAINGAGFPVSINNGFNIIESADFASGVAYGGAFAYKIISPAANTSTIWTRTNTNGMAATIAGFDAAQQ